MVPPDTGGPRVRMGLLWFFLALAAVTSGRWWTAVLAASVAAAAGFQVATVWRTETSSEDERPPIGGWVALLGGLLAGAVPLAAGYGTGAAGAVLIVIGALAGTIFLLSGPLPGATLAISAVLPALAAASIVLAVRVDLWAGLFLVLAVSLFDAGNFLLGADATGRWEGPVAGVIGAMAVTFTMSTIGVPPFERPQWWVTGVVVACCCVVGQWVSSAVLPSTTAWVPAMRRLDGYVVSGPAFIACTWLMGS